MLQSLPRWLSGTEREKQDDEDMGMKCWRKKKNNCWSHRLGSNFCISLTACKVWKKGQVLVLKLPEPDSSCSTAQHSLSERERNEASTGEGKERGEEQTPNTRDRVRHLWPQFLMVLGHNQGSQAMNFQWCLRKQHKDPGQTATCSSYLYFNALFNALCS